MADSEVTALVLATPAVMHYAQVKQALEAGKHVFVEKPLALNNAEGMELVELAKARNLILMVGHILEYHPAVALQSSAVATGARTWSETLHNSVRCV